MTKSLLSLMLTGALTITMAASSDVSNSSTTAQNSFATQLKNLQNASSKERIELMNQLKERIASMSQSQREEVMQQLHKQMKQDNQGHKDMEKLEKMLTQMHEEASNHQEHSHQMQEHMQQMQNSAHMEMEHNEHMNQKEAGDRHKEQMQKDMGSHSFSENGSNQRREPFGRR